MFSAIVAGEAWKFLAVQQGEKKVLEELEREDEVKRVFVSEGETKRGMAGYRIQGEAAALRQARSVGIVQG